MAAYNGSLLTLGVSRIAPGQFPTLEASKQCRGVISGDKYSSGSKSLLVLPGEVHDVDVVCDPGTRVVSVSVWPYKIGACKILIIDQADGSQVAASAANTGAGAFETISVSFVVSTAKIYSARLVNLGPQGDGLDSRSYFDDLAVT